jgi:chromodomain-helicase-DNA-binding protein 1
VASYNEDEDEDTFEADEDETTPNYWATAAEDVGPAVDKVLDHRPKSDTGMNVILLA